METNTHTTTPAAAAALLAAPRTQEAFGTVRSALKVYGALGAAALVTVVAVAISGHTVNTFMWVRAVLLPVVAMLLHRMTVSASRGSKRAYERVSALTVIMPVAVIGVDLIPGVCPLWYAAMQVVCMVPVVRAAFVVRGAVLRGVFTKGSPASRR
ncbi:hypothetical protein [Streptomyces albireticuli]|uniref:hypothetical protein n=1 Tax=Streptomyces albireticuli TaxID=1940 RepID=UPI0036BA82E1